MRPLAWAFAFFVFDRDASKARPGAFVALTVLGLYFASDRLLSGNWRQQAGFATATHAVAPPATTTIGPAPAAAISPPSPSAICRTEAAR